MRATSSTMIIKHLSRICLAALCACPAWAETDPAPYSLTAEVKALYRLFSGDELIGEFETKEEVDAAAINAVRRCTKEVNYVYTETVAAGNSLCDKDAGHGAHAPADARKTGKTAPEQVTLTDTSPYTSRELKAFTVKALHHRHGGARLLKGGK